MIKTASFQHSILISSTYRIMLQRYLASLRLCGRDRNEGTQHRSADAITEVISPNSSVAEVEAIIQEIEAEIGHSGFGIDIAKTTHPSDYGLLGYAAMNSPTLYEALSLAARYKHFLNQGVEARLRPHGHKRLHYTIKNALSLRALETVIEMDFASAFQFARLLAGPYQNTAMRAAWVHFQHAPKRPIRDYEEHFHCPVRFNQRHNCMALDTEVLQAPVYGANPEILAVMLEKLRQAEQDHRRVSGFSERVFRHLQNHLGPDFPDASRVADAFHVSLSAFKKRLKQEQSSFRQLADDVRQQAANAMLHDPKCSVKEIAWKLGFTSSSAFNHAFKRWTGMSPAAYARQIQNKIDAEPASQAP